MDEAIVKANTLSFIRLASARRAKPVVASEFTLGTSGVRADLAVLDEDFVGIEIKTEKDTLKRLSAQMEAYQHYFNSVVLIAARCHLEKIQPSMLFGASVWTYDEQGVNFKQLSNGRHNRIAASSVADLMTQIERKNHPLCAFDESENVGFSQLSAIFKKRYAENSKKFWKAVSRRSIRPGDLSLLSRFAEERQQARLFALERESRWSNWLEAQGCLATA